MRFDIFRLNQAVNDLQETVASQEKELNKLLFSYGKISDNSSCISFYTGFADATAFESFFEFLKPMAQKMDYRGTGKLKTGKSKPGPPRKLSLINEFLMTLVRLKVGLLEEDLADRFQVSLTTISRTTATWISLLYHVLTVDMPFWMERSEVDRLMPLAFQHLGYSDVRVVLDATEIPIDKPSHPKLQRSTWSEYKQTNTLKGIVGISPNGCVTFVSKLFGGRSTDIELTLQSGLLEKLGRGDAIMADRGFDLRHETSKRGIRLYIPPFTRSKSTILCGCRRH